MKRRTTAAVLATAALTLSGCGFKGLYTAPLPGGADLGNHPFTITAEFSDVLDLVPQSAVKVNDVSVGKVTAISLSDCDNPDGSKVKLWCAKVTMDVNDSVHLPANAQAEIAQTSLLGEKYVALMQPDPAVLAAQSSGAPVGNLKNGSNIPLSRSRSAPEVEDVLGALSLVLNRGGLEQIQVIARELNTALHGNEGAVRSMITQLDTFVATLDRQKDDITNALVSINRLAQTLNAQTTTLNQALDTFPQALSILSQERGKLVTLLTSLARLGTVATGVINATQTDLVTSLKALDPVVTRLAAAGNDFPQSLRIIGTFPFPLGTTRTLVRGDYANLDAVLNLDLSDELCGLSNLLCKKPTKTSAAGQTNTSSAITPTGTPAMPRPVLIGSGR